MKEPELIPPQDEDAPDYISPEEQTTYPPRKDVFGRMSKMLGVDQRDLENYMGSNIVSIVDKLANREEIVPERWFVSYETLDSPPGFGGIELGPCWVVRDLEVEGEEEDPYIAAIFLDGYVDAEDWARSFAQEMNDG